MKSSFLIVLSLYFSSVCLGQDGFKKNQFYKVLSDSHLPSLVNEEKILRKNKIESAFIGAILMKKAGLMTEPVEKIKNFKDGKEKLESAIKLDSSNVEWRFLRLIIQENSPKILQYNQQIQTDASYLRANYSKLDEEAQNALYLYVKTSHVLIENDFKKLKHE